MFYVARLLQSTTVVCRTVVMHQAGIGGSLVPRLSVKREMWGRKGEPGFYCRPDPSHSGGFRFPPYFSVFDFIIIIILSNQRFFVQDGEFSVSSSVSSSDSSSHYPQALSHALSMLGLPELLLKEEQKLAIRAVFDGKDMFVPLLSRDLRKEDLASSLKLVMFAVAFSKETILLLQA